MREFQNQGWISVERRRISVAEPPALKRCAQARVLIRVHQRAAVGHQLLTADALSLLGRLTPRSRDVLSTPVLGHARLDPTPRARDGPLRRQHAVRRGPDDDGELVMLDAGTGIRELGRALIDARQRRADHRRHLPHATRTGTTSRACRSSRRRSSAATLPIWGAEVAGREHRRVVRDQMIAGGVPGGFEELAATHRVPRAERTTGTRPTASRCGASPCGIPGGAFGYRLRRARRDAAAGQRSSTSRTTSWTRRRRVAERRDDCASELVEFARGAPRADPRRDVHRATNTMAPSRLGPLDVSATRSHFAIESGGGDAGAVPPRARIAATTSWSRGCARAAARCVSGRHG